MKLEKWIFSIDEELLQNLNLQRKI